MVPPTQEHIALLQLTWLVCTNRDITSEVGLNQWSAGSKLEQSGLTAEIDDLSKPKVTRHFALVPAPSPTGRVLNRTALAGELSRVATGDPAGPLLGVVAVAAGVMHDYVDTFFWTAPPCPPEPFYKAALEAMLEARATDPDPPTEEQLALILLVWLLCSNRDIADEVAAGAWTGGSKLETSGIAAKISGPRQDHVTEHFKALPKAKSGGDRVLDRAALELEIAEDSGTKAGPLLNQCAVSAAIMHDYVDTYIWTAPPCPPLRYYKAALEAMLGV